MTWGSPRQAGELAAPYRMRGHTHLHVDDRALLANPDAAVAGVLAACAGHSGSHWVNVGRASMPGAVQGVARAWDRVEAHLPCWVRRFGPAARTAAILDDKWRTHQALLALGIPVVSSRLARVNQLAGATETERVVVKLLDRTGGVGVVAAESPAAAARQIAALAAPAEPVLVCRFIDGLEMSVKVLSADEVLPVALVLKERTRLPVVHGDWKIKVAVPLSPGSAAFAAARTTARGLPARGFLSLEGVADPRTGTFLVSEVAGRRTGSFTIADAVSTCGPAAIAIPGLLGLDFGVPTQGARTGAVTVALQRSEETLACVAAARSRGVLLGVDQDDLADLPGSSDSRQRVRIHLAQQVGQGRAELLTAVEDTFGTRAAAVAATLFSRADDINATRLSAA